MITGIDDFDAARRNRERVALLQAREREQKSRWDDNLPVTIPLGQVSPFASTLVVSSDAADNQDVLPKSRVKAYCRSKPYKRGYYNKVAVNIEKIVGLL